MACNFSVLMLIDARIVNNDMKNVGIVESAAFRRTISLPSNKECLFHPSNLILIFCITDSLSLVYLNFPSGDKPIDM